MRQSGHRIIGILCLSFLAICIEGCEKEFVGVGKGNGLFSVSESNQVKFAMGNLADGGRSFVADQWEYGDLFGWGSGNHPADTAVNNQMYAQFSDWGDRLPGGWRTMSHAEWRYLLFDRNEAGSKRATATVNGVQGLILLPDSVVLPPDIRFYPGAAGWNRNNYTDSQWQDMEEAGVAFIPAAGYRKGSKSMLEGVYGFYWSSTSFGSELAYAMYFYGDKVNTFGSMDRYYGMSIRLVKDYK